MSLYLDTISKRKYSHRWLAELMLKHARQVKHADEEDSETPLLSRSRAGSVQGMYLLPPSTAQSGQNKPPKWKFLRDIINQTVIFMCSTLTSFFLILEVLTCLPLDSGSAHLLSS